jgi:myo-inositol 2-dehydrogenase / D-chiro-inositol 1-dehydrogenase
MSTRRTFLKTSAAGAALGMLANVHAAGSDTIKVGIIGCGGRGGGAALDVLQAAPGVQVVALGDVFKFPVQKVRKDLLSGNPKKEAAFATVKELGNTVDLPDERCFVGLDCHEKVLSVPGLNYVILASPPGFRPMHLQAAVQAGKHIFTEKPVSVDGPGTRKVLDAYNESLKKNLCIAAGTQRRHQAPYIETIRQIHDGAIGDITSMRCFWNSGSIWFKNRKQLAGFGERTTDLAYHMYNWYHFVWTCGDHIVEQHVHNLDVCNWAMKNAHPIRCLGMGSRLARPAGEPQEAGHIFDNFAIDYEYPGGVHMLSMCRHIPGTDANLRGIGGVSEAVVGTKGTSQVDAYTINGKPVAKREKISPYVQEHTDLIACIRNGKPINELKNVAESTLTAIMGRMSAYTGKAVTWEQALNSKEDTFPGKLDWDMKLVVPPVAVPGKTALV